MSSGGRKIIGALEEAAEIARKASAMALIIQRGREDGDSATMTAYEILDELGICKMSRLSPKEKGDG